VHEVWRRKTTSRFVLERVPSGAARPAIAIPIVTQHELIGFALFGNRHDGALPDPEEIGLLANSAPPPATPMVRWKQNNGVSGPLRSNVRWRASLR